MVFFLEVLDLDDVLVEEEELIHILVHVSIFIILFFEGMKEVKFLVVDVEEAFEAFSLEGERFERVLISLDFDLVQELLDLYVLVVEEVVFSFS